METKKIVLICSLISISTITILSQIPTDGLVGYWPFTENANDESGNNHHGTVYGATLTEDRFGNPNSAYYFDGVDDYIAIAPSSLVDNETKMAVSCWIKREALDEYGLPVHTGNQGRFGVSVKKDSASGVITTNSSYDGSSPTSFGTDWIFFDQTKWTHIVMSLDGSSLKFYINNVLRQEMYADGNIWTAQSSYLAFGVYMLFGNPNHGYYKGILDDVRLYNTALTVSEISSIYQENMCSDTIVNDTTTYYVSSIDFSEISPLMYHDSTTSLLTSIGGCDSIIHYHSQFVFDPTYCTDTTFVTIHDTITTEVFDTTYVTVTDSISVTDTLIIDAVLTGIDPPDNINTLKIYPNPARDHIFINTGDYTKMNGYQLKIIDQLGAVVFETNVEEPLYEVNLSTWSGIGLYYVQVIDPGGIIIDIRKIVLQ